MRLFRIVIASLTLLLFAEEATAETVTTTDGRTLELKDDGTYEVVKSPPKRDVQRVDVVDLQLEADALQGKHIKVRGTITTPIAMLGGDKTVTLYQHSSMTGVMINVNLEDVPTASKRKMLEGCNTICPNVEVVGVWRWSTIWATDVLMRE